MTLPEGAFTLYGVNMKKLVSLLLVLAMLVSAMPVVFAAGSDDYFDVSFDNQAPSAGGEVTATISLKKQISGVSMVVLDFSYNKDYFFPPTTPP